VNLVNVGSDIDVVHRSESRRAAAAILLATAIAGLPACANSEAKRREAEIRPTYDKQTGKLTQLAYDSDHDGTPDTWTDMDGTRPVQTRIDRNGDGRIDRWEDYDASGALVRVGFSTRDDGKPDAWAYSNRSGGVERIEISSTGNDKKIDRWEYYDPSKATPDGKGALVRTEEDTIGDGKPHKWETYSDGALETVAFDEDGDGRPDRRLTYRASILVAIESHPDGAGHFTVRKEIHNAPAKLTASPEP
jgi:hypothetical protein